MVTIVMEHLAHCGCLVRGIVLFFSLSGKHPFILNNQKENRKSGFRFWISVKQEVDISQNAQFFLFFFLIFINDM